MLGRVCGYARRHHIGFMALFIALSGTAYAASLPRGSVGTAQLRNDAVTSPKVEDRTLVADDFKRGELPRGERGPRGARGARGARGERGRRGRRGSKGAAGAAGATNVTVRTAAFSPNAGGGGGATAACTGGERATGGGYTVDSGTVTVQESRPEPKSGTPTGWRVSATATSPSASVSAFVVCAAP